MKIVKDEVIIGAVFPIPSRFVSRIFDDKKDVFVKFSKMNKLQNDSKILFYASPVEKAIVGEGIIKKIEFLSHLSMS